MPAPLEGACGDLPARRGDGAVVDDVRFVTAWQDALQSSGLQPSQRVCAYLGSEMMTETTETIRVLLAEDNYVVREGIRALVETQDSLDLVGTCGDLSALTAAVEELSPDVVLTDIRMPPTQTDEGVRAAEWLRDSHPDIGVVVLSQYVEEGYAVRLFDKGSSGRAYLLKERVGDVEDLVEAIREVHRGGSVVDRAVVDTLIAARSRQHTPIDDLTSREREVLSHIARGRNNKAIADQLVLSPRAVEKHINSIFAKLGLADEPDSHHRVRAVLLYMAAANAGQQ